MNPLLAPHGSGVHTPSMTLKSAAFLALIGTAMVTILLTWNFIVNVTNVMAGVTAAVVLLSSLIYAFGALSVAVYFYVAYRAQK